MRKAVALLRAEEDSHETGDGLEKEEKEHPGPQAEGLPNRTWIPGKKNRFKSIRIFDPQICLLSTITISFLQYPRPKYKFSEQVHRDESK
jgi:hypothetical protein